GHGHGRVRARCVCRGVITLAERYRGEEHSHDKEPDSEDGMTRNPSSLGRLLWWGRELRWTLWGLRWISAIAGTVHGLGVVRGGPVLRLLSVPLLRLLIRPSLRLAALGLRLSIPTPRLRGVSVGPVVVHLSSPEGVPTGRKNRFHLCQAVTSMVRPCGAAGGRMQHP